VSMSRIKNQLEEVLSFFFKEPAGASLMVF
jgi:hypothetical protein